MTGDAAGPDGRSRLDWRRAAVIAERDLRVVLRSRAVTVPMLVVPLVVLVMPPVVLALLPDAAVGVTEGELSALSARLPDAVAAGLPADEQGRALVLLLVYVFAPLYLLVPLLAASVSAADSIVGERERGTLEGLLLTPTTDRELLVGKLAAPFALAVAVALLSAVAYGAAANLALVRHGLPVAFPNTEWTVLTLWVAPAVAALALGAVVAISSRVRTFQEANQLAGIIVVPLLGLVVAQAAGVLLFDVRLLAGLGAVVWALTFTVVRASGRLRRDRLLSRA